MTLKSEIFEQPEVLERQLDTQLERATGIAGRIREAEVRSIFLAARGSSDNAGLYAKYLFGIVNRLPVALAAPSMFTTYDRPPDLSGQLVLGISQSGQSPDIVSVIEEGRRQGALTLAITNEPDSPLGEHAELVLPTMAGAENAIAATKTYSSQLLAIALLSSTLRDDAERIDELRRLPDLVARVLELDEEIRRASQRYRYMSQCVVLGRGFNYATAYEWSLKLKELAYVVAEPYSSADFRHGPVALVSHGFPVLAVAPSGAVLDDLLGLLSRLVQDQRAELLALSDDERALELAQTPLRLPDRIPEWLTPIVSIVPAQLFCYHLTRAMGYDTERPRQLSKITRTW
jgi:glucosamine--fructose-6-phosphate aminotransferase (isomerizing)